MPDLRRELRFDDLQFERLLRDVLASTVDRAMVVVDEDGTIVAWRGAAERLFGYAESEVLGLDYGVLFTANDRELTLDRQEMAAAREMVAQARATPWLLKRNV